MSRDYALRVSRRPDDDPFIRVLVIVCLSVVCVVAIIGITVAAVTTDRNLIWAEGMTFGGVLLVAVIGGATLWRRKDGDDEP